MIRLAADLNSIWDVRIVTIMWLIAHLRVIVTILTIYNYNMVIMHKQKFIMRKSQYEKYTSI